MSRQLSSFLSVITLSLLLTAPLASAWAPPKTIERRAALAKLVSVSTGILTTMAEPSVTAAASQSSSSPDDSSFDAYYITPVENTVRSKLDKIDSHRFLKELAIHPGGSVWLGEHHNSISDHNFQATVIRQVHRERSKHHHLKGTPMAVGLEQVQSQFQPVLDAFIQKKISLEEMKFLVQWDKRWTWSFDNYKEIFVAARDLGIRLMALNVDSEDLVLVEKMGYPGLPSKKLHKYIKDPIGFAEFAKTVEFKTYNDYVIKPSYDLHQRLGLLQYTMMGEPMESEMTFGRFLSGRILWDEGMASSAFSWCQDHPDGLLIGLVGADHVKFKNGVPGRFSRMASNSHHECTAVVINPTLIDSRPSGTVARIPTSDSAEYPERVTLQLRYTKAPTSSSPPRSGGIRSEGVLAFSDYVVVT